MGKYLLGLDNGNTVCKAVLFDLDGKELQVASCRINTHSPKPGHSERSMKELWDATARSIQKLMAKSRVSGHQIIGIGNAGHGNGLYLLDKAGHPLRGIQSLDSRAKQICQEWKENNILDKIYPHTFQEFWPAQTNSLLAWIKRYEPQTYENIGAVLLCKDYLNHCLTGEMASDYSDMSATNLLNIKEKNYRSELLRLYGIEDISTALPKLVHSFDIMGKVSKSAAEMTGLAVGTPVVGGLLDVNASMIGSGVIEKETVSIIAGTWSVNSAVTGEPQYSQELAMSAVFAVPNRWLAIEASATSLTNLDWFITNFCEKEQMEAKRRKVSVYTICDEVIAALPPDRAPIIFHPFLHGSNTQANAKAGFFGLAGWHTRADVLRSLYEGVVFCHASHIAKLKRAGLSFQSATLTGGGGRSAVLSQIFADVLDVPVQITNHTETGALGAALSAGIGTGIFADYKEATQETVTVRQVYEPNPSQVSGYRSRWEEYNYLVQEMEGSWNRLAEIR